MHGKKIVPALAVCLATSFVVWATPSEPVRATGNGVSALVDSDEDFLPDSVEWTMLTSSADPDTDGDAVVDFLEVVSGSDPRSKGIPLPADHQLRLVMTGPSPTSSDPLTWIHVFLQLQGAQQGEPLALVESFALWLEVPWLPGLRVPLDAFAPNLDYADRDTPSDGTWVRLSIPFVHPSLLLAIGQSTIWAEAVIDGSPRKTGMELLSAQGDLLALVPLASDQYVLQSISPLMATDGLPGQSNRVCVLELREVGSGPGGTQYEVLSADCQDANELECAASCVDSAGMIITIPGGTELLGGN